VPKLAEHNAAECFGELKARIRKTVVPVVYTDVTSMYPTVNTLAQLWDLLIAKELCTREVTRSARAALKAVTLEQCLSPGFWPRLRFFAEVEPAGDILPVRARHTPGSRSFTIGVSYCSADETLWYSGFDLAASALLTGRVPRIRQAFTIEGEGELASLQPVTLRGRVTIDPREQDFFRTVIEERHRIKHLPDEEMSPNERKRWKSCSRSSPTVAATVSSPNSIRAPSAQANGPRCASTAET
jgi:hypothetical protein